MNTCIKKQTSVAIVVAMLAAVITNGFSQTCTVDWNNVHQRIDGFGASSAWQSTWTTTEADLLFSTNNGIVYTDSLNNTTTNNGIGLSLLRNHIAYASSPSASVTLSTSEISIMQMAQARGALIWSTPWTPAAGFKSVNDIYDSNTATGGGINGGSYLGSGNNPTNLAYASQLANYVHNMGNKIIFSNPVHIYAISIQNEPDANVTSYEACQWTGQQIHDFVTNLYNALVAKGVGSTKIILPESQNWQDYQNLAGPAMNDPNVAADVGIIADHNYDGNNGPTSLTKNSYGKSLWETEVSILSGSDGSINNGVYWGQRIYLFMTQAQANAYNYWWLMASTTSSGNEGLLDNYGSITKRFFVFGQYSRFVRPGYYRINASTTGGALISAYQDTNSGNFAIVAVNTSASSTIAQTFNLTNFPGTVSLITPWATSATMSLSNQPPINLINGSFNYTLPALSVVTFVGQAGNIPPTLQSIPDQEIGAGMTLAITNKASAPDVPPQTLTFDLLNAPTNATLDSASGIFTWRPLVSQANTTNVVTISVVDNDSTDLSTTNGFKITVNPLAQPTVNSINTSGGQVSLVVNGPIGPDYTLLTSTNLTNWQVLFTTNSPVTPITLIDSNLGPNSLRFYRIQLGPK